MNFFLVSYLAVMGCWGAWAEQPSPLKASDAMKAWRQLYSLNDTVPNKKKSPAKPVAVDWRTLTPGEIEMAGKIFREGIEYSRVRIYCRKYMSFQSDNQIMAPNGHIYCPPGNCSPDFSRDYFFEQQEFIHEMAHVYQYHQGINVIGRRLSEGGLHSYKLIPGKSLNDYTLEQQAQIMADYFACTLGAISEDSLSYCRSSYMPALEQFFRDPNYLRADEDKRMRERSKGLKPSRNFI